MFFAYDKHGLVAFYSETPNEAKKFSQVQVVPTPEEMEALKKNYILKIKGSKLVVEKPDVVNQEEKAAIIQEEKKRFRKKAESGSAKVADCVALLEKLIN